jgi:hypothetical protein
MGSGRFTPSDFKSYATSRGYDHKRPEDVINTRTVNKDFLAANFKNGIRESRDSADNPNSTPIIVAGDVTGSMGRYAGVLIKEGLAKFAVEVYGRKPVSDPHIMGMAIGDVECDSTPVQATQFEADIRIIKQFEELFVEGGGGGNRYESYHAPWVLAALKVETDAWKKRKQKGILITYGDEQTPGTLTRDQAKRFLAVDLQSDLTAKEALQLAQRTWDVYHLIIEEGSHCSAYPDAVINSWRDLLGQNAIRVSDHQKLAEVMVSILQVRAGVDKAAVVGSWKGDTALVVSRAVESLLPTVGGASEHGVVHL